MRPTVVVLGAFVILMTGYTVATMGQERPKTSAYVDTTKLTIVTEILYGPIRIAMTKIIIFVVHRSNDTDPVHPLLKARSRCLKFCKTGWHGTGTTEC
jgi:hypothetical protein